MDRQFQKSSSKLRELRAKSVDTLFINDATEAEAIPLCAKVE
jgi:hypothetical protein